MRTLCKSLLSAVILANGSGTYLGVTGPLLTTTYTFLRQSSPGYFQVGACS